MLGQNYFHTRSKLGSAVYALSQLGEQAGVSSSRIKILRNLMTNLKDPFLFVVVGEVNAGKSTLLNAVFGSDFCSTDVLPTTDRIGFFKYGEEAHEFEVSDTLMEVYRPNEFLKDFNVVDTPGTNSIERHHERITEHFILQTDATWTQAIDKATGNQLPVQPEWVAFAQPEAHSGTLSKQVSDIMGFFQVAYVGKTYDDPANLIEVSARTVLATGVGVDLFESRLGLSFRVDDLLDVRGQDLIGYPLPGRRYTAKLSYRHAW